MKYLKYITLIAFLAFAVSCSKDDDEGKYASGAHTTGRKT